MRHKWFAWLLILVMVTVFSLSGCGWKDDVQEEILPRLTEKATAEEIRDTEGNIFGEEEEPSGTIPVMGDGNADYDGFTYLYADELMIEAEKNEETADLTNEGLVIYVPLSDNTDQGGNFITSNAMGAEFRVSLNGIELPYDHNNNTAKQNLEYILNSLKLTVSYNSSYEALEQTAVKEAGESAYSAAASYLEYDESSNEYYVRYNTYFIKKLSPSATVVIQISVHAEAATEQTEALIQELEAFYGFPIEWDPIAASQKLDCYKSETVGNTITIAGLVVEIPNDWEKVDVETYKHYAGWGNSSVLIIRSSPETIDTYPEEEINAVAEAKLSEIMEGVTDIEVTRITDSNSEFALKCTGKVTYEELEIDVTFFLFQKGFHTYMVFAADYRVTTGAELAEHIFETARIADTSMF